MMIIEKYRILFLMKGTVKKESSRLFCIYNISTDKILLYSPATLLNFISEGIFDQQPRNIVRRCGPYQT